MSVILNIETATKNCSVSLSDGNRLLALKELAAENYSHAEKLHVFIDEVFKKAKISPEDIVAVAVGKGPGSFTGLRIGVAAAKGLCMAWDKPLVSVDTLKVLAKSVKEVEKDTLIVPVIDARRMEVYSAVFDSGYEQIRPVQAQIIDAGSFRAYLSGHQLVFLGDGADKCAEAITHENATFLKGYLPSAKEMPPLSFEKYKQKKFEDVAYFEPFYLKDFIVGAKK